MPDWNEDKRLANLAKHGVDFAEIERFDWDRADIEPDRRRDYSEDRFTATGFIDLRLHVLLFTRRGGTIRVISLRKANRREVSKWERHRS